MKRKIYKTRILMLFLALVFQQSMAQQEPVSPKKPDSNQQNTYQQQMKNLQQNMRELQKQITDLQRQHIQKNLKLNTDGLKRWNFQRLDSMQNFVWADSLRSLSRSLKSNIYSYVGPMQNYNYGVDGLDDRKASGKEKLIEKTKTISKSYAVDKNEKLSINNQYGKITVNTWNKMEFKVEVEVTVGMDDEAETQKLLDGVEIVSSQDEGSVSFKTIIPERTSNNSFFGFNRSNGNRTITINYTVFMPVKNALSITNRFGSVILPDLEGPVTLNNSYGSLVTKALDNVANELNLNFGNATIESLNGGNLKFNYGNLKIGTANNLNVVSGFSPVSIDLLKSSGNIKVNYGSGLKIGNIDKNLKNLDINASFTSVSLNLNGSENFNFDVTVKYNRFNHNDDFVKVQDQPENDTRRYISTKNYKGYVGKAGSDNKVIIRSNYSGVNFN
ncbi:MAG: hypothetical protein EOP42_15005 [Sphingobacteriaceae bacterium]|nr:MAG: hypothetical protein EOP42_15005 [Sphingobacteriaceae bacterium]